VLIFGAIILVVASIVVVAIPLVDRTTDSEELPVVDLDLAGLQEEKESAYNALKEAEFDYETGKLSDEDYEAIKKKYRAKAVEALEKLEKYQGKSGSSAAATSGTVPESIEGGLSPEGKANFCTACGNKLAEGAKFCPGCGQKL